MNRLKKFEHWGGTPDYHDYQREIRDILMIEFADGKEVERLMSKNDTFIYDMFNEFPASYVAKQIISDKVPSTYLKEKDGYKPLADDILALAKTEDGKFVPIKEPVEIEQVIDIVKDKREIEKIEENITIDTNVSVGEVKRGDILYLTALLKRTHQTTPFNQTTMGVLKVRVIDYYYGLNKLKQVMKNK